MCACSCAYFVLVEVDLSQRARVCATCTALLARHWWFSGIAEWRVLEEIALAPEDESR